MQGAPISFETAADAFHFSYDVRLIGITHLTVRSCRRQFRCRPQPPPASICFRCNWKDYRRSKMRRFPQILQESALVLRRTDLPGPILHLARYAVFCKVCKTDASRVVWLALCRRFALGKYHVRPACVCVSHPEHSFLHSVSFLKATLTQSHQRASFHPKSRAAPSSSPPGSANS
jgi:hypothetical protein